MAARTYEEANAHLNGFLEALKFAVPDLPIIRVAMARLEAERPGMEATAVTLAVCDVIEQAGVGVVRLAGMAETALDG